MEKEYSQEEIMQILKENKKLVKDAESSAKEIENFSKKNNITYEDIETIIQKLPKELQNQIINEASEISKSIITEIDEYGQEQKRKLNRKMSRYKNRI